jgi:hypothetical protein
VTIGEGRRRLVIVIGERAQACALGRSALLVVVVVLIAERNVERHRGIGEHSRPNRRDPLRPVWIPGSRPSTAALRSWHRRAIAVHSHRVVAHPVRTSAVRPVHTCGGSIGR